MPRCYNSNDPELNSTAWFAEYIGPFMPFLSLGDLQTFGSAQVLNLISGITNYISGFVHRGWNSWREMDSWCVDYLFNVSTPSSSAGYPGVHSKPSEHRPPQPRHLTSQPHQLLHWAGLSTGRQLQPLTVSLNPKNVFYLSATSPQIHTCCGRV